MKTYLTIALVNFVAAALTGGLTNFAVGCCFVTMAIAQRDADSDD